MEMAENTLRKVEEELNCSILSWTFTQIPGYSNASMPTVASGLVKTGGQKTSRDS